MKSKAEQMLFGVDYIKRGVLLVPHSIVDWKENNFNAKWIDFMYFFAVWCNVIIYFNESRV